jgi:hypothetical protein
MQTLCISWTRPLVLYTSAEAQAVESHVFADERTFEPVAGSIASEWGGRDSNEQHAIPGV